MPRMNKPRLCQQMPESRALLRVRLGSDDSAPHAAESRIRRRVPNERSADARGTIPTDEFHDSPLLRGRLPIFLGRMSRRREFGGKTDNRYLSAVRFGGYAASPQSRGTEQSDATIAKGRPRGRPDTTKWGTDDSRIDTGIIPHHRQKSNPLSGSGIYVLTAPLRGETADATHRNRCFDALR